MKRSQINAALREMEAMCRKQGFCLPPFCALTLPLRDPKNDRSPSGPCRAEGM